MYFRSIRAVHYLCGRPAVVNGSGEWAVFDESIGTRVGGVQSLAF